MIEIAKHLPAAPGAELQNWAAGAGDDARVNSGKISYKNTRLRVANGTKHVELATLDDVVGSSSFRGGFGATGGGLPNAATATIRPAEPFMPGQFLLVTADGTIAGIGGADTLSSGDLLFFLGSDPAIAANWHGVSRGLDLSPFIFSNTQTLASLPANTATRIPPVSTMLTVTSFLLTIGTDVANGCFDEQFSATGTSRGITLTSLVAKTNVSCLYTGLSI